MGKKVIHLNDEAHAAAKKYCEKMGIPMSEWIAKLIDKGAAKVIPLHGIKPPKLDTTSTSKATTQPPFGVGLKCPRA